MQWLQGTALNSSIALIQFGHRYGWSQYEEGDQIPQGLSPGDIIPGRRLGGRQLYRVEVAGQAVNDTELAVDDAGANKNPNFDVEVVVPIGGLADRAGLVVNKVNNAFAIGVTPTYQAIFRAYKELGNGPGHIIVLTDGAPFLSGVDNKKFLADLQNTARDEVRLSIVTFATNLNDAQKAEFKSIPGTTLFPAGSAKNEAQLLRVLQSAVSRKEFVWKHGGDTVSGSIQPDRYVAIDRDWWPPPEREPRVAQGQPVRPPEEYRIEMTDRIDGNPVRAALPVEGGEAFELRLQGDELVHVPFPRENPELEPLEGTGNELYAVLAWTPNRVNDRELSLRLVIENADPRRFTPRPSDVWIELTGSDARNIRKVRFSISDCEFETPQPVPVLVCRVDWPNWATRDVQIDAWMRFADPVAPRTELPLNRPDRFTLDSVDSVDFLVKTDSSEGDYQVSIIERHEPGVEFDRLRILLEPLPYEATTERYPEEWRVERVYKYRQRPASLRAYVTTKDQIIEGATLYVRGTAPPIRE